MIQKFEKKQSYMQYLKSMAPSVMTMVLLSFYTAIDGFFAARYAGSDALAGINIAIPLTCIVFGVSVMMAAGSGAVIGELLGRKDERRASGIFSMISAVLLLFSLLFTACGLLFLEEISVLLGASSRLLPYVRPYAALIFLSSVSMSFKLFFEYIVRCEGYASYGLLMSAVGIVLNVVLDWLLTGVLPLGTLGAGIGTALSVTASAVLGLLHFLRRSRLCFCRPLWDGRILLKTFTNGSSEMLTEFSTGIVTFLFNLMAMKYYQEDGVAAVTILMNVYYFFISFYMGIAAGIAPVISYSLGAGSRSKIRETLRYSFRTLLLSAFLITALSFFARTYIISLFVSSGRVFAISEHALKLFSALFLMIGWNVFFSGYFTALGCGLISAVISTMRSLILTVFFIFLLPLLFGADGLWLAMPAADLFTLLLSFLLYFRYGRNPVLPENH